MAAPKKITAVRIIAARRPGKAQEAIQAMIDEGWDWNGRVELSSTDGFVAVFTTTKAQPKEKLPERTPRGTKFPEQAEMVLDDPVDSAA